MKDLKWYLISRLIFVLIPVVVLEQLLALFFRRVVFPFFISVLLSGQEGAAGSGFTGFLLLLRELLFGNRIRSLIGLFQGSLGFFFFVFTILVWLLPVAAGILFYATLVEKKVKTLENARDEERKRYDAKRYMMLSDFAHDLRTPVMTVSGYSRALCDGMVKDEHMKLEYLEAISRKSERLSELINMLFEYVKLESENFSLKKVRMDLHELFLNTAASFYMDIEDAGMELVTDIPEEEYMILADRSQLTRILENLFKNAIRHNPQGTVIYAGIKKIPQGEDLIIADSGILIEKSEEELFSPFIRGDESRSGDEGSGLGLSISSKIAKMHGYRFFLLKEFEGYTKAFVLRVFADQETSRVLTSSDSALIGKETDPQ